MDDAPQRITLMLEHSKALREEVHEDDQDETEPLNPWCVVGYLIRDSGRRDRATLQRCESRDAAAQALEDLWNRIAK